MHAIITMALLPNKGSLISKLSFFPLPRLYSFPFSLFLPRLLLSILIAVMANKVADASKPPVAPPGSQLSFDDQLERLDFSGDAIDAALRYRHGVVFSLSQWSIRIAIYVCIHIFSLYHTWIYRKLLALVQLPKEAQQIDRAMQDFASRYHECNPDLMHSPGTRWYE